MRLFAKLTGGRVSNSRALPSRELRASARPSVSFSGELRDAIEAAQLSVRESDDDGIRVAVICPALRGAFIFSREEAARRIRAAFPELLNEGVARAVNQLESRVRIAAQLRSQGSGKRSSWAHGWGWQDR